MAHSDPLPQLADHLAMINELRVCVLLHDAKTYNILWANPAACELLEFTLEEIRPLKANDMSSSAQQYDRVIGRAWLQDAAEHGFSSIEWHYRSKSGRVIPTDALATRVELAHGPAIMVQFRDIEREQEVERSLRRATSSIDALARHTSTIALILDGSGLIQFATDSAVARLGAVANEALHHVEDYAQFRLGGIPATWREVRAGATPVASVQLKITELPGPAARGAVWLEGSVERLREHEVETFLMLLHDVSDRVATEVERHREQHRANYLARYDAMGDMAMAIAHELGQPLAATSNFLAGVQARIATLQRDGEISAAAGEQLDYGAASAARQISRAAAIVDSVRSFVGHLEHSAQRVDLNEIVEECLYFIRLRAAPAMVEVVVRLDATPVIVHCERVLIGQVILNLCFNAIEEMAQCPPGGRRLDLSSSGVHDEGVLIVDDHGRGFVRDPFAESFTSKEEGSGIGLALSYRIVTRQHGRIWAEHRAGGGSRFAFALPLAR